jgi:putative membrane-bound dehydrogenase-like protein
MKLTLVSLVVFITSAFTATVQSAETKPLRALLVCGGCCHDYAKQHVILKDGIQARANVQVSVVHAEDRGTAPYFPLYENKDWSKGYDIIIHDECAASMKEPQYVQNILDAHRNGLPGVNLHCAMHSYRIGKNDWFDYIGLQSTGHGPQEPIEIKFVDTAHPITSTLKDWTTIKEELYNNVTVMGAHPLAMGKQRIKQKDGATKDVDYVVAWTNEYGDKKTKVFSTTIGHNNETVADARYLDLVTRGLLWAAGKLNDDYLKPYKGEPGTFVNLPKPDAPPASAPAAIAKDATPVKLTASSEESGKGNFAWRAVDGDKNTRWCANSADFPQWLQLEFEKPQTLSGANIVWEGGNNAYKHVIEGSADGKTWSVLADAKNNQKGGESAHTFTGKDIKFVRITCYGSSAGSWASIREVALKGDGIKSIGAKPNAQQAAAAKKEGAKAADPFAKEGNIVPKVTKLTPEQEAEILKDVKVADGFEATLFAPPQTANYPVFIAAAPNGDLYVSSDGNGSLGRNPKRGRILRLRDKDGDGRADEVTEFVKDLDAPRGLVWDHDRLYVVHPPDLSGFIDKDGDGVAEERKTLIKGIAFGYDQRPADHTTNGLSLGIDGWLYIAGGDFGFMDAEGTDGKHLQHRGGGVIRLRPDGTNLELYATGTRNILEVAISPLMDIFTRDNTNDGGGWNVRFHHFTGGFGDHGYPRFYKNFNDEAIQPLADYGGGSGCGAVYIDEPGFGTWNNAPFTADWGTGALWHHSVKRKGATYEETEAPKPFIKMTRPTDGDVDAMSRVYCASWKGATFNWEGPDVGYIVCVKPKGYKAEPLPDFAKASDAELVKLLESPSNRRRMEAQRELVRRGLPDDAQGGLSAYIHNERALLATRAAAYFAATQVPAKALKVVGEKELKDSDTEFAAIAARGLSDVATVVVKPGEEKNFTVPKVFQTSAGLAEMSRFMSNVQGWPKEVLANYAKLAFADQDPVTQHVAVQALAKLKAYEACFALFDSADSSPQVKLNATRALQKMHEPAVVDGIIKRINEITATEPRKLLLSALCRLHFHEGEWKGDSWGTRPDTRGPYYQPEAWSETPKVGVALKDVLSKATPEESSFLVSELNRNRIQFNEALERILTLAKNDAKLIPDAVGQLASADTIPAAGVPLLVAAAQNEANSATVLSQAVAALAKTDSADGAKASLTALVTLGKAQGAGKEQEAARTAFLTSPKLENHHQLLEAEAEKVGTPTAQWADMALLNLSARTTGSPESRELSGKALDAGWQDVKRRTQILKAVASLKHNPYADKVLAAMDDSDKAVASAAQNAAKAMKLEKKTAASGPLISTLKPEEVIAQVLKTRGDVALGEQIFARATCVACHTTSMEQPQKGPYLGNIAQTYKRPELAQNILDPNKTIAQGFASELFTLKDGSQQMGFITLESADSVKVRNIAAQEFTYAVKDITKRDKLPMSMMPPGLVNNLTVREFASLLDYLEALAKK